jgi:hypothetical protein
MKRVPSEIDLGFISSEELSMYYPFAVKARRCLELFRMKLIGHFTLLHLWPEGFDFSIEWFTDKFTVGEYKDKVTTLITKKEKDRLSDWLTYLVNQSACS